MPTIAAGASAAVTLQPGFRLTVNSGSGVAVHGPGPTAGMQVTINGPAQIGPFAERALTLYLTAGTRAIDYDTSNTQTENAVAEVDAAGNPTGVLQTPRGKQVSGSGSVAVQQNDSLYLLGWSVASSYAEGAQTTNISGTSRRLMNVRRNVSRVALYTDPVPAAGLASAGETVAGGAMVRQGSIQYPASATPLPFAAAGRRRWGVNPGAPGIVSDVMGLAIPSGTQIAVRNFVRSLKPATPTLTPGTGGSLAEATYFVKIADRCEGVESYLSSEVSAAVSASGTLQVAWTGQHRDDEQIAIYVSTATGAQTLLAVVPAHIGSYTINSLTGQGVETGNTATTSQIPMSYASMTLAGEGYNRISNGGNGGDLTAVTTAVTGLTGPNSNGTHVFALLGDLPAGESDPCIYAITDSIGVGVGCPTTGGGIYGQGLGGYHARALFGRDKESWHVHGIGGTQLQHIFAGTSFAMARLEKLRFARVVYSELGINDNGAGRTWSQLAADQIKLAKLCRPGTKFRLCTLTPACTMGDFGITVASQTKRAQDADRVSYNTWVRNGSQVDASGNPVISGGTPSPYIDGANFFDAAAAVEVNASNVLTPNGGFWLVPSAADSTGWVLTGTPTTTEFAVSGTPFTVPGLSGPGKAVQVALMTSGAQSGRYAAVSKNTTSALTLYASNLSGYTGAPGAPTNPINAAPAAGDAFDLWRVVSIDGVHPTEYGYSLIAAAFAAHLAALYG